MFLDTDGTEIALARTESKDGTGYSGFSTFTDKVSIEEDLKRRDLTINAIAVNNNTQDYIDPFNGITDIENKILRHVNEDAFAEDPIRILRLARFQAKFSDFRIYHKTKTLAKQIARRVVDGHEKLTKERIKLELMKVLKLDKPSIFFYTLLDIDEEFFAKVFPSIYAMVNCEHRSIHHLEGSVFEHTMMVIDVAASYNNIDVSIMSLFHDLCKPETMEVLENRNMFGKHSSREIVTNAVKRLASEMVLSRHERYCITSSAIHHGLLFKIKEMNVKKIIKKITCKHFPTEKSMIESLIITHQCDAMGRTVANMRSCGFNIHGLCELIMKIQSAKVPAMIYDNYGIPHRLNWLHQERIKIWKNEYNDSWINTSVINDRELVILDLVKVFTDAPGAGLILDGPYSGELFRETLLKPFLSKLLSYQIPVINLNGAYGYSGGFLREAFSSIKTHLLFTGDEFLDRIDEIHANRAEYQYNTLGDL